MSIWLFNFYMDAVMKDVKIVMGRKGERLEEDLRAMVGRFVGVCRRRCQKINAGKSKVMVLGEGGGVEVEGLCKLDTLEHVQIRQSAVGRW